MARFSIVRVFPQSSSAAGIAVGSVALNPLILLGASCRLRATVKGSTAFPHDGHLRKRYAAGRRHGNYKPKWTISKTVSGPRLVSDWAAIFGGPC